MLFLTADEDNFDDVNFDEVNASAKERDPQGFLNVWTVKPLIRKYHRIFWFHPPEYRIAVNRIAIIGSNLSANALEFLHKT